METQRIFTEYKQLHKQNVQTEKKSVCIPVEAQKQKFNTVPAQNIYDHRVQILFPTVVLRVNPTTLQTICVLPPILVSRVVGDKNRQFTVRIWQSVRTAWIPTNLIFHHKVRHPHCVYNKLDCSVYTCLT